MACASEWKAGELESPPEVEVVDQRGEPTDDEIVSAFVRGDPSKISILFERYDSALQKVTQKRLIRWSCDYDSLDYETREICDEAWTTFMEKVRRGRDTTGYVMQSLFNEVRWKFFEHWRRFVRSRAIQFTDPDGDAAANDPLRKPATARDLPITGLKRFGQPEDYALLVAVLDKLDHLPARYEKKLIVLQLRLDGLLTEEEIGAELGISDRTVRRWLKQLRKCLGEFK